MTRRGTFAGLVLLALTVAACSDDTGTTKPPDLATRDRQPGTEASVVDQAVADLPLTPDQPQGNKEAGLPDQPKPDQPALPKEAGGPDQTVVVPDGPKAEALVTPDGPKAPDLPKPDLFKPPNSTCAAATTVTLTAGKATVTGTTAGSVDEYSGLRCGALSSTPLLGPQVYYSVALTGGKIYRFALTPSFDNAHLYLFSAASSCQQTAMETNCQSAGATGTKLTGVAANATKETYFSPVAAGTYVFGVDGLSATDQGAFTVVVEELPQASNATCATSTPITLTAGAATVTGNTYNVTDEFSTVKCGGSTNLDGPQVYYSLQIAAGKSYELKLSPMFSAYLYIFSGSGGCGGPAINGYCSSGGSTGDVMGPVAAGTSKAIVFSPSVGDTYIIAIDSSDPLQAGSFVLDVKEVPAPANATCATAQQLTLTAGKASVTGTTAGAKDEFPTLKCGGGAITLDGPQVYYKLAMTQGKGYKLTLDPTFSAYLVLFTGGASCAVAAIETDCASQGATGNRFGPTSSKQSWYFLPATTGTWVIAVDSTSAANAGGFTLDVEEYDLPANRTCAGALPITMSGSSATVTGTTGLGIKDEFATVSCGGAAAMDGPQLYYKVTLGTADTYRFKLTPTFDNAYVYVFPASASCQAAAIQTGCTGHIAGPVDAYGSRSLYFKPTTAGDYIVAVDSSAPGSNGDFTLSIDTVPAPTNGTCATATQLTITGGSASVTGDTYGVADQFATLQCGLATNLDGPQLYYKFDAVAGKTYKIVLKTAFNGYLVVFSAAANCTLATMETDCASGGTSGDALQVNNTTWWLSFKPTTAGTYYIAVDSTDAANAGYFELKVQEFTPATNGVCTAPQQLTLTTSPVTVSGDTDGATNQFGTTVTCGTLFSYDGPQVYYLATLQGGKTYTVKLDAAFDAALYAFTDKTCMSSTINTQCTSWVSDVYGIAPETITLSPATTGDYILAVDSYAAAEYGPFTMTISWP